MFKIEKSFVHLSYCVFLFSLLSLFQILFFFVFCYPFNSIISLFVVSTTFPLFLFPLFIAPSLLSLSCYLALVSFIAFSKFPFFCVISLLSLLCFYLVSFFVLSITSSSFLSLLPLAPLCPPLLFLSLPFFLVPFFSISHNYFSTTFVINTIP